MAVQKSIGPDFYETSPGAGGEKPPQTLVNSAEPFWRSPVLADVSEISPKQNQPEIFGRGILMKKLLFVCALAGLAFAATRSYTFTLYETAMVGGTELKPGSYKVDVDDQKAVIHNGKEKSEVPVKIEQNPSRYIQTSVRLTSENGKYRVDEIHIGGSKTKLVLNEGSSAAAGQQ